MRAAAGVSVARRLLAQEGLSNSILSGAQGGLFRAFSTSLQLAQDPAWLGGSYVDGARPHRHHAAPLLPMEQLSYVRGPSTTPLLEETLAANLERTAERYPDSPAVVSVHQGLRLSYRELVQHVGEVARGLLALGVAPRDRVAVWAPNCAEWTVLQFATAKVGAILVNVNPAYRAGELAHALRQSGTSVLVMAPELKGASFPDMVESVAAETPALKHKIVLGPDTPEGYLNWYDLRWAGEGAGLEGALRARAAAVRPGDPQNLQYTSGTTGLPKAATLSHRNILNNGYFIGQTLGYSPADRVCIPVPLFHCFGMVLANLACSTHGAAMVYPAECFDAEATLAAVESEACTSLYGVPTMFLAELEHPLFRQYRLGSLRTGIMAGSPCPVEVMKRVRSEMHMRDVTICYGMTETSPVSFQTSTADPVDRRVSTVGRIHPHLEARVVDPVTKQVLPRGEVGELCVRGYSTMLGYWNDAAATAKCLDQDGWMHTGDLAAIDAEGYATIQGRIKDMCIRGGENVYPREIEEFLHQHPAVADVQVFGVPDRKYGEELCAWVRLKAGYSATEEELRAWCRGRIAHYKVPRYWKFITSYPMTVSGKPQKYLMRQQAAVELGLAPPPTPGGGAQPAALLQQAMDAAAVELAAAELAAAAASA